MAFTDPFPGMVPGRMMNDEELLRALRLDVSAEEDAASLYTAHADATDNVVAKTMLMEVSDDERRHIGVFTRVIEILTEGEEKELMHEGAVEVNTRFPRLAGVGIRIER